MIIIILASWQMQSRELHEVLISQILSSARYLQTIKDHAKKYVYVERRDLGDGRICLPLLFETDT